MRVVHVDTGRELRGGQRQVLFLMEGLAKRGVEQALLAAKGGPLLTEAQSRGWDARPAGLVVLRRASRNASVLHAHDARAHTLGAIASLCPVVVSRRVSFRVKQSWFSRWKYRRAAVYLAVSKAAATELERAGVPESKIRIVPDGVPCSNFQWQWREGGKVVAIATEDPAKGSDMVREAADKLALPVHFSENLAEDLRDALAFVYISRAEGLGSAALLAMSMGVPVVASKIPGLDEVFEDGISGLYVNNQPEAIAAAILRLADDRAFAEQIGAAGGARVCEMFSVDALAEGTLAAYRSVI